MSYVDPMMMDPYQYVDPFAATDSYIHPKDYGSIMKTEDNLRGLALPSMDIGATEIANAYLNRNSPLGNYQGTMPFQGTGVMPGQGPQLPRGVGLDPQTGQAMPMPTSAQAPPGSAQGGGWGQIFGNPVALAAVAGGGLYGFKKLSGLVKRGSNFRGPFPASRPGFVAGPGGQVETLPKPTGAGRAVSPRFVNPATGRAAIGPLALRGLGAAGAGALTAAGVHALMPEGQARDIASPASGAAVAGGMAAPAIGVGAGAGAAGAAAPAAALAYIASGKGKKEQASRTADVLGTLGAASGAGALAPITGLSKLGGLLPGKAGEIASKPAEAVESAVETGLGWLGIGGGGDDKKPKPEKVETAQDWLAIKAQRGHLDINELATLDANREAWRSQGLRGTELKRQVKSDYFNFVTQRLQQQAQAKEQRKAQQVIDQMYAPYLDQFIGQGLDRAETYEAYAEQLPGDYGAAARTQAASTREYTLKMALAYKQQVQQIPMMEQAMGQAKINTAMQRYGMVQQGYPTQIANAMIPTQGSMLSPLLRSMGIKRRGK